jgi:uncharacterized protein YndB with AHSA1/START domain
MTEIKYEIQIVVPVKSVYEYYTDPEHIKKAWPSDIVKESEIYLEPKMKKVFYLN